MLTPAHVKLLEEMKYKIPNEFSTIYQKHYSNAIIGVGIKSSELMVLQLDNGTELDKQAKQDLAKLKEGGITNA